MQLHWSQETYLTRHMAKHSQDPSNPNGMGPKPLPHPIKQEPVEPNDRDFMPHPHDKSPTDLGPSNTGSTGPDAGGGIGGGRFPTTTTCKFVLQVAVPNIKTKHTIQNLANTHWSALWQTFHFGQTVCVFRWIVLRILGGERATDDKYLDHLQAHGFLRWRLW